MTAAAAAVCSGLLTGATAAPGTEAAAAARAASGGTWGTAQEIPGTAALNLAGGAEVSSVWCAAAGNCSAGGYYNNAGQQALVVDETNGA